MDIQFLVNECFVLAVMVYLALMKSRASFRIHWAVRRKCPKSCWSAILPVRFAAFVEDTRDRVYPNAGIVNVVVVIVSLYRWTGTSAWARYFSVLCYLENWELDCGCIPFVPFHFTYLFRWDRFRGGSRIPSSSFHLFIFILFQCFFFHFYFHVYSVMLILMVSKYFGFEFCNFQAKLLFSVIVAPRLVSFQLGALTSMVNVTNLRVEAQHNSDRKKYGAQNRFVRLFCCTFRLFIYICVYFVHVRFVLFFFSLTFLAFSVSIFVWCANWNDLVPLTQRLKNICPNGRKYVTMKGEKPYVPRLIMSISISFTFSFHKFLSLFLSLFFILSLFFHLSLSQKWK